MDTLYGVLTMLGGFGLAVGLTVLGMNAVLRMMPRKNSGGTASVDATPNAG